MRHTPQLHIFVNARAGATPDTETLQALFGHAAHIIDTDPASLHTSVAAAAARGDRIVGVAGGDGTMRSAASALIGTETALLCVPTGTLNHFARRHGIDSLESAASSLAAGRIRQASVGTLNDGESYFLNTLTFGEYSRMLRIRERMRRAVGKWTGAFIGAVVTLASLRRFTVVLEVDGRELVRRTAVVWIGVGRDTFPRVHDAPDPDGTGDLEVTIPHALSRSSTLALAARLAYDMVRGRAPLRDARLEVLHAHRLTLLAGRYPADGTGTGGRIDATADGELIRSSTPLRISIREDALPVVEGPDGRESAR